VLVNKVVKRVLGIPVVRGDRIVLGLTVVGSFGIVTPGTVTRGGFEINVIVIGVFVGAFVVQRDVDITLPDKVFDQRFGFDDLLNARQLNNFRRLAIGQNDLAVFGRLE